MQRQITRVKDDRFCALEVRLEDRGGKGLELSICGTAGYLLTWEDACKQALEYWRSFFEDCPEERHAMADRFDECFCGPNGDEKAAQFVVDTDGEHHGLDVVYPRNVEGEDLDEDLVFCCTSCGQIREEILEYFPEVEQYLVYHLNGSSQLCPCMQGISTDLQRQLQVSKQAADQFLVGLNECGTCGSVAGDAWHHEALPQHVIDWASGGADQN